MDDPKHESFTESLMKERTPSWSTIEGMLSDKYGVSDDQVAGTTQPTQSTQNTVIQRPLTPDTPQATTPLRKQFRRSSADTIADLTYAYTKKTKDRKREFGASQKEKIDRLKREIWEEERRLEGLSGGGGRKTSQFRSSPGDGTRAGLDASQQLSHSILEEQSRARLAMAKPAEQPREAAEFGTTMSSISVDMTPLTEDLLMNSRADRNSNISITQSDGGITISDGQFPNMDPDDEELLFTPISDDDDGELTRFATPPRTFAPSTNVVKPTAQRPTKRRVQLRSQGKIIGNTELGSHDDTSSLSIDTRARTRDVQPLKRHAWSDSETENSMSKSMMRKQFEKDLYGHKEPIVERPVLKEPADRPKSALASVDLELSPRFTRPFTAPSSEKIQKFEINRKNPDRDVNPIRSDSTINSDDYPNLKNSFISLQQTIMSDIAALRKEIVEKQAGTERLRVEFSDFKHAYYESLLEKRAAEKAKNDAMIQTSQGRGKENLAPAREYQKEDDDHTKELAQTLQRSLQLQAEKTELMEQLVRAKLRNEALNKSMQTSPGPPEEINVPVSHSYPPLGDPSTMRSSGESPAPPERRTAWTHDDDYGSAQRLPVEREVRTVTNPNIQKCSSPKPNKDDSLDSTEEATREVFMEILRKKAELSEKEKTAKRRQEWQKQNPVTPAPRTTGLIPARSAFTPASTQASDDCSTITDGTYIVEDEVAALDGLWQEFMKFVIKSKALKRCRSGKPHNRKLEFKVDPKKLQDIHNMVREPLPAKESTKKKGSPHKKPIPPPEAFEINFSPDEKVAKEPRFRKRCDSPTSIDSREERINFLLREIQREKREAKEKENAASKKTAKDENKKRISDDLDRIPAKESDVENKKSSVKPTATTKRKPVAFDISWGELDSMTSEEVERAPGYPNMIFKSGKLQDAFYAHRRNFIKKSRRRALHIQLRKEAREKYRRFDPPVRPRKTVNPKYFKVFDIPPPHTRIISRKEMKQHSKELYHRTAEVQEKARDEKREREKATYRLRGQLYSKRVQEIVLGKKYMNSVTAY